MKLGFIFGCKHYDDPDIAPLNYADRDAECFAETILSNCGFVDSEIRLLSSGVDSKRSQPTKSNILRELSQGRALAGGESSIELIVFFFSGHGFHSEADGRDYLAPQDAVYTALEESSIAFDSIIRYLQSWNAEKIVLFLDACRAVVEGGKNIVVENLKTIDVDALHAMGMASFSSCSPHERSYEVELLRNGIFTYSLCEALSGVGKCKTIYELDSYLTERIPQICKLHAKPIQNPYTKVEPLSIKDVILVSDQRLSEWRSETAIGRELRPGKISPAKDVVVDRESVFYAMDFGTSYSAVAVLDDHKQIRFIPSSRNRILVPSVVTFLNNLDYVVGWDALEYARVRPQCTVFGIKRLLGSGKLINVEGRALAPEFIASLIIKSLKKNAEEFLSAKVERVIAAVPANFSIVQNNALAKAFQLANLKLFRLIGEPCASAILVSEDQFSANANQDIKLLVLDLGGGTFDVSMMESDSLRTYFETTGVAGDNNLGGMDFDDAIFKHVVSVIQSQLLTGYNLSVLDNSQIRSEVERAKIALSSNLSTSVILQNLEIPEKGFSNFEIPVTREVFRELTSELNARFERCINAVVDQSSSSWAKKELDVILLAGQGLKMFTVKEILSRMFPGVKIIDQYQESAVIQGLCKYSGVLAGIEKKLLVLDSNYTAIGVVCAEAWNEELKACVISGIESENQEIFELLPLNTMIPTKREYYARVKNIVGGKVTIKLIEKSALAFEDATHSSIGQIEIEVTNEEALVTIGIDSDANRTLTFAITNPATNEVLLYQINNFFTESVGYDYAFNYPPVEGLKYRPIQKLVSA